MKLSFIKIIIILIIIITIMILIIEIIIIKIINNNKINSYLFKIFGRKKSFIRLINKIILFFESIQKRLL